MKIRQNNEIQSGAPHNTLAARTVVVGNITTETDFRIDGTVEGDITCKGKVVIGELGVVKGHVVAENAEILGSLDGSIRVNQHIAFRSKAKMLGGITAQTFEVEPGANFEGKCSMCSVD